MKNLFKTIIASVCLFAIVQSANAEDFDYTQTNVFVKNKETGWTLGARGYINKQYGDQFIVRKDFQGTPYRLEYRYNNKSSGEEHWLRAQYKLWNNNGLFFNPRIEHRIRESRDNIFRFRPQFGYVSTSEYAGLKPFIIFEPHWSYNYSSKDKGYSHMQTFIGAEYKVLNNFKIIPYIEYDTDKNFDKEVMFAVVDFKFEF